VAGTSAQILAQARIGGERWWLDNGGIYHLSCQNQTSWFGFAQAILAQAGIECPIEPIRTDEYPTAAFRPRNSVLGSEKLISRFCDLPDWRSALRLCMQ
jgi:dTDP-4-dehydrorhamnose reductase